MDDETGRRLLERVEALTALVGELAGRPMQPATVAPPTSLLTVAEVAKRYARRTSRHAMYSLVPVLKFFGDKPVTSLRRADWLTFRDARMEESTKYDRPPTPSTLNQELAQTLAMLRWAVSNELIDANPFEGVKKLKGVRPRETVTDPVELAAALADAPLMVRVFQIVCSETGMRNGSEVRRLEWTHIDWATSRISVPAANTKTKSSREVPMTDYCRQAIEQQPRLGRKYVFENDLTRLPYSRGYLHSLSRQYLNRLTAAPGDGSVRTHDHRHALVSRLGRLGLGTFKAMKIVGHKSAAMHWRYDHLSEEDRGRAKELLDGARKSPHGAPVQGPQADTKHPGKVTHR